MSQRIQGKIRRTNREAPRKKNTPTLMEILDISDGIRTEEPKKLIFETSP